tara:strand:- start:2464 stop:2604 length:141 start_codon:yes stop_codon:yes gene_type:complete
MRLAAASDLPPKKMHGGDLQRRLFRAEKIMTEITVTSDSVAGSGTL